MLICGPNTQKRFWLIAKMLLVAIPVIVLVLLQKTSTMLVFLAILGSFLMSGITWKIIVPVFILAALVGQELFT